MQRPRFARRRVHSQTAATTRTHVCLKGTKEMTEEGMFAPEGQDLPLNHGAFDVVVLQDNVLFQTLDGVVAVTAAAAAAAAAAVRIGSLLTQLGQDHLAETALAKDL